MRRFFILLVLCFLSVVAVKAEDLKPPVPLPAGDGSDILPPPMDLSQLTPLPLPLDLPANPQAEPAKKEAGGAASPSNAGQTTPTAEALKALNAAQAVPPKIDSKVKAAAPTATPVVETAPAATPTPEPKKETVAPSPVLKGTFADYFPTAKGTKWSYEYLKVDPGTKAKKTRTVESMAAEQDAAGTVSATFQVTEDGKTTEEKYSLSDNKVAQTVSGTQALTGEFTFQFPSKTAASHWTSGEKVCKSFFGKGQVYKKVYPDCVIVSEKITGTTVFSYYAKGIGLVTVEVYGKGMKLDQSKSFALVSK